MSVLYTQQYCIRKENKMQGIGLEITLHDILEDDVPPEDGYYYMLHRGVNDRVDFEAMYWHSDKKAWSSTKESDKLLVPADYWGHLWTDDFLTGVVEA